MQSRARGDMPEGDAAAMGEPRTMTEPRTVTITVPCAPSPLLSPNKRNNTHWRTTGDETKALRKATWAATMEMRYAGTQLVRSFSGPVDVHEHIVWPVTQKRRFDPDSLTTLCKPALDGIVDAGIIPNDSAVVIRTISASQERSDDQFGRIEITVREAVG
jgi:crossover junction endodeoxyribonuclease RusA